MGLFKKNKNQIPEISKNQVPPSPSTITAEIPAPHPSIAPQTPIQPPHPELPHPSIAPQTIMNQPKIMPQPLSTNKIPSVTTELSPKEDTTIMPEQPFFVRIDKFSETKENFHRINQKMKEMEKILDSLESTKNEEDRELNLWKEDMNEMKSLLRNIDKEIFNKI